MNIENDPSKTEGKIVKIIARSFKPKPVQEIADEIQKTYDETQTYLQMIGKRLTLTFSSLPDGGKAVRIVTGPHKPRFR